MTAKEKSRRTTERFSRACEAVALIEPPFLFVFATMLVRSEGRHMGGYRRVNLTVS